MKYYKLYSLCLVIIFAIVGLTFLLFPDSVLDFFNVLSNKLGFTEAPLRGMSFYLILAVAYMYVVTLLAYKMFRNPDEKIYPFLLIHAKLVSSILSLYLFITEQQYLIFLVNFVVDGFIGISVIYMIRMRKGERN